MTRRGPAIGLLLPLAFIAAAAPAKKPAPSCAIAITASADGSFAEAGYESGPARLSRLAALTRDRFAAAARSLCARGELSPADLGRFARLVVQNGEGATEPVIYRDPQTGPRTFVFQYAFQNGEPPDPAAFEQALRCWKRPRSSGCYED